MTQFSEEELIQIATALLPLITNAMTSAMQWTRPPQTATSPASVVAFDPSSLIATVYVDGDTVKPIQVQVAGEFPAPGDRVLVSSAPDGTAWVTNIIGHGGMAPGTIYAHVGAVPPGSLAVDASVVPIASYPALYAQITDTYNTGGEGPGNFRLPPAVTATGYPAGTVFLIRT